MGGFDQDWIGKLDRGLDKDWIGEIDRNEMGQEADGAAVPRAPLDRRRLSPGPN